ncbi:MAG: exosortase [Rhodospirillales bacterium]|nr:exosortase [Rhodospirillales bacterium]
MNHNEGTVASTQLVLPPAKPQAALGHWRATAGALAIIGCGLIAGYWQAAAGAVRVWYASPSYNHGFLVLPIVLYLVWERRELLRGTTPMPAPYALLLMVPAAAAWLLFDRMALLEGQQLALFCSLQAVLLALLGFRIYGILALPFLYLFFLIPTGQFLVPYLQDFTAHFIVHGLQLTGIPVYSDGIFISIPNGMFEVAEACAGLRFLTATLAFGVLFADFAYESLRKKFTFLALCVITPIIANGLRAYGIVIIAYFSDNEFATGVDHLLYGWIFFSIVTVGLAGLGLTFRDAGKTAPHPSVAESSGPARRRSIAVVALIALTLLAMPRVYAAYVEARAARLTGTELLLPIVTAPWQRAGEASATWRPELVGLHRHAAGTFRLADADVDLFIGYYNRQTQAGKLISSSNHLVDPAAWTSASWSSTPVTIGGETIEARLTRIVLLGRKRLVLSWYWVDGRFESRTLAAKLLQAKAELMDDKPAAAAIAIATDAPDGSIAPALARLTDFASHLGSLRTTLEQPGGP